MRDGPCRGGHDPESNGGHDPGRRGFLVRWTAYRAVDNNEDIVSAFEEKHGVKPREIRTAGPIKLAGPIP